MWRSDVVTARTTPHSRNVNVPKLEPVALKNLEDPPQDDALLKSLEPQLFPDEDTDEGQFFSDVLNAVQRWFCCSGWPNSINLVTVPDSFRRYTSSFAEDLEFGSG